MELNSFVINPRYSNIGANSDPYRDFFLPCFSNSNYYGRYGGFFTSKNLVICAEGIEEFIKNESLSVYHPIGTCKMGAGDECVVDKNLKVRGIQGLRVADASIFPSIISGISGIVLPHCLVYRLPNSILLTLLSRHCLGSAQFRTQIRAQSFHCMVILLKQFAEPFKQWNQRFLSLQCGNPVAGISSRDSPR